MRLCRLAFFLSGLTLVSADPESSDFKKKQQAVVLRLRESARMLWNIQKKIEQLTSVTDKELMVETYEKVKSKKGIVSEKDRENIATVYYKIYEKDLKRLMEAMHHFPIGTQEMLLTIISQICDRNYVPVENEDAVDDALAELESHPEWMTVVVAINFKNEDESSRNNSNADIPPEKGNDCAVCLETIGDISVKTLPACNHKFHLLCILKWYYQNRVCPVCRVPFTLNAYAADDPPNTEEDEKYDKYRDVTWLRNEILRNLDYIYRHLNVETLLYNLI